MEPTHNLRENLPNKVFAKLFLVFDTASHDLLQIPSCTVLHDDVDHLVFLVDKAVVILDNVFVLQFAQNIDFCHNLRLFLLVHLPVVHFLPNKDLAV